VVGTFKYKRQHTEVVRSRKRLAAFFCKALNISGVAGLAVCLVRGIIYDGGHRMQRCIFLEKANWGNRTVLKKYCRE